MPNLLKDFVNQCPVEPSKIPGKNNILKNLRYKFLFEVSWEVCNKVGGIYTVLRSKLKEAIKNFDGNYILIGPLVEHNRHFVEDNSPRFTTIANILREKNINCKVGYWDTEGNPTVILVDFKNRYKIDNLLYNLWADFKVDSLASNYDYQEPILFSTAAGEIIETLSKSSIVDNCAVVAHFHEWLCGGGLLYLKKNCSEISTVFSTHATVLGRSLASVGISVYNLTKTFDPTAEARTRGVFAKHSLEKAAATYADCFTTVSIITADEACLMLGKYPDKIIPNGLDAVRKQQTIADNTLSDLRYKLREITRKIIGKPLPENTLLWMTSGRYEFHNKGFDVLLKSLAQLEKRLPQDAPPIVLFFLIAANWHTSQESLLDGDWAHDPEQKNALGIATHRVYNPDQDSIIKLANELDFKQSSRKIHIVFSDAYLTGKDGVFDIPYEQTLAACDFSIFPSFYEPWGYTPLESIAQSTPTITTDLAGFGNWVRTTTVDYQDAVYVLDRKNKNDNEFTEILTNCLENVVKQSNDANFVSIIRKKALVLSSFADWHFFYDKYLDSYYQALSFNEIYHSKFEAMIAECESSLTAIYETEATQPRFHTVQYDSPLPRQINELRELAYNFWWSWHEDARVLFKKINPELWQKVKRNPVHFLNLLASSASQKATYSHDYMYLYEKTINAFHEYIKAGKERDIVKFCDTRSINDEHPIAYFCMEYGIDESLPIYSGGLGILAGDYLKAMSDLKIPFIAIGLFYKQGYFSQSINTHGEQVAIYRTWNTNQLSMRQMSDVGGKLLLVGIEILSRTVYAKIWEVLVGHVKLYLLDTDVPENIPEDRDITNSLYGGSREVRVKQEMILGIGGVRLLLEKLNITPALYHLNEGHSAFLLLERIRYHNRQSMTLKEAIELVRSTSIFTTHTPVPAGNEEFSEQIIRKYFTHYAAAMEPMGTSLEHIFALAYNGIPNSRDFSMTALSLRLCLHANAVSTLHGKVARKMWQGIWPSLLEEEVPISHVTNGVHVTTWLGQDMKTLYDDYMGTKWETKQNDLKMWQEMLSISSEKVWKAHQIQKEKLITIVKDLILQQYSVRNASKQLINSSINCLNNKTLLLGLARRFTSYKRNDLILMDQERLATILTNKEKPVVMLIAGKAHPADGSGNALIRGIIEITRNPLFNGHIIFLEEYNIGLAKLLVQGIDVWINTPIVGREACGTSGMKVGINGGLNFSTKDGWWEEACNADIGWEIGSIENIEDADKRNDIENMFLMNTLEKEIVPLYYNQQHSDFNPEWVNKMKASIALVASQYNTSRMAKDYIDKIYCPAALYTEQLLANSHKDLKEIVAWKQNIADRFSTVKIKALLIDGIKDGKITSQGVIKIKLLVFSGKLTAPELQAELVLVETDGKQFLNLPKIIPLKLSNTRESGEVSGALSYTLEYKIEDTGFYSYAVRVFPYNEKLLHIQDTGLVYWI